MFHWASCNGGMAKKPATRSITIKLAGQRPCAQKEADLSKVPVRPFLVSCRKDECKMNAFHYRKDS